ncbi:hypothetical protein SprV_0100414100 [Sparganum proliferum]
MNCPVKDKHNQKADLENRGSYGSRLKNEKSCAVCGDHAVGYNFGAIACESCKAFFRRNALRAAMPSCLFSGKCSIQVKTRRFCSPCRLEKCFAVGMRKSCIMDEKAKIERREKIQRNRERKTANQAHLLDSSSLQHQQLPGLANDQGYLDHHLSHQQQLTLSLPPEFSQNSTGCLLNPVREEGVFHAGRLGQAALSHNRPSQTPHPTCDRTPYNLPPLEPSPASRCPATPDVPWHHNCACCMPSKGPNAGQQTLSNCDLGMPNYLSCPDGPVLTKPSFPSQASGLYEESPDFEFQPPPRPDGQQSHVLREVTVTAPVKCERHQSLVNRPPVVTGTPHAWPSTLQSESSSIPATGPLEESTLAGSASSPHSRSELDSADTNRDLALYSRPSPVTNVLDGHVWTSEPEERSNKECVTLCPSLMRTGMARLLSKDQWTALNDLRRAYDSSFLISASDHTPENSCTLTLSSLVNTSGFLVRKFISFAKKLADFNVLGQEGQVCLLKGVVLNAIFIRSASHYDVVRDCWVTPKGDIPTRILKVATGLENLYEEHAKFCRNFSNVVENDSHLVALMQVLCLFAPDRRSLVDRQSVSNIYDRYILLLKHYLEARHGFTRGRTLLASVLTSLAELETLTDNYGHILLHVDPSKVDPLILDVFNLSRRAADQQSTLTDPTTSTSPKDTGEGTVTSVALDSEDKDLSSQHASGLGTPTATDTSHPPLTHSMIEVSKS